jgi:putative ABC transport system substrate-binding protein
MASHFERRKFLATLGAAAWPLVARAQQDERMRRIGVMIGIADDAEGQARLAAFQRGMQELGWNEGREIQMAVRFTASTAERARTYAAELVSMTPDAIVANTATVVSALRQCRSQMRGRRNRSRDKTNRVIGRPIPADYSPPI